MQQRLLKTKDYTQPYLEYGMVVEEGDLLRVETSLGSYAAMKAASCLVRPRQGDSVLTVFDADGNCFILSVLMQNQVAGQVSEIILEGDASLHIRRGGLTRSEERPSYRTGFPWPPGPAMPPSRNVHSWGSLFLRNSEP